MKSLFLLALFPLLAVAQTTFTAPDGAKIVYTPPPVVPPVTDPPPVSGPPSNPPPVAGTFWLYKQGVFKGAGSYDFGSGHIVYGPTTVTAVGDVGWQPRMPNDDFDTTGYHYITVSIRPTQAGNTWITGAEMIGDKGFPGCPNAPSIMKYGPNPAIVGQWNTYKIPLSAYCITPALHPYKIMFLEQSSSNKSGNKVEYDAVGFVP
jgi:hypothetical protein